VAVSTAASDARYWGPEISARAILSGQAAKCLQSTWPDNIIGIIDHMERIVRCTEPCPGNFSFLMASHAWEGNLSISLLGNVFRKSNTKKLQRFLELFPAVSRLNQHTSKFKVLL
jgi:hypothetical protein